MLKLGVNIDHVATLREARYRGRGHGEPDPVAAALACEAAGAHGITAHLREDRRHIQDRDIWKLREVIKTRLNLEMANVPEIVAIALKLKPDIVCLVPERRQEVTTEGGLDAVADRCARDDPRRAEQRAGGCTDCGATRAAFVFRPVVRECRCGRQGQRRRQHRSHDLLVDSGCHVDLLRP